MLNNTNKTIQTSLLITCLLFMVQLTGQSQDLNSNKGKTNIGFDAGIQFTGVEDPYSRISEGGIGYNFGPSLEYYLSDFIKIKGAIQFDNRAFTLQDMGPVVGDSGYVGLYSYFDILEEFQVNYLTIPLSLIYIKGTDKFKFYVQGTFYYSILLNSKQTGYTDVYISETDAPHYHFTDYPELSTPGHHYFDPEIQRFNSSDMGINLNIGGIYFIKPKLGVSLSSGFTYAFSNVWEDPSRSATWTRIFKVTMGVVYSIK